MTPPLPNIESYGAAPLAFTVTGSPIETSTELSGRVVYRTAARALGGMQKEALVKSSNSASAWRFVCDEGPYLNGTDLAPPPLAYFSAGMASCYADAILAEAGVLGHRLVALKITQDNRYTMEGSALRGTMAAGALPVEIEVDVQFANTGSNTEDLVTRAVSNSPVSALMVEELIDTFSITHNGLRLAVNNVTASGVEIPANPAQLFENIQPDTRDKSAPASVSKLSSTASVFEEDHGSGAAMKDKQKRELHIRSVLSLGSDGLRDIRVQIFKPVGSLFGFVCDVAGTGNSHQRAPDGLTLVSAGTAFCFMTQIGRFAGITKKTLSSYSVIQNTVFGENDGICMPVDTHAYIESPESPGNIQEMIDMSEQTCFLHAACRQSNETIVKLATKDR